MVHENPEEIMTFGELLTLIADQQRRLTVLESAFSSLSFCLDEKTSGLLIQSLRLEAQNQDREENMQQQFARLADHLEQRLGVVNISPDTKN